MTDASDPKSSPDLPDRFPWEEPDTPTPTSPAPAPSISAPSSPVFPLPSAAPASMPPAMPAPLSVVPVGAAFGPAGTATIELAPSFAAFLANSPPPVVQPGVSSLPLVGAPTPPPANAGGSWRGPSHLLGVRRCGRIWYWRTQEGYTKRNTVLPNAPLPATLHGTLLHDAVLDWYAERMEAPPSWYVPGDLPRRIRLGTSNRPKYYQQIMDCAEAYKQRYAEERDLTTTLTAEMEFVVRLGDLLGASCPAGLEDEVITCQNDRVYRASDGRVWVWDLKTVGAGKTRERRADGVRPDGSLPTWDSDSITGDYVMNAQAHVNLRLTQYLFPEEDIAGFVIQRLTRELTDRGVFDMDRNPVITTPLNLTGVDDFIVETVEAERRYAEQAARGRVPGPSFACHSGYACDYLPVCTAADLAERQRTLHLQYERQTRRPQPALTPRFRRPKPGRKDPTW